MKRESEKDRKINCKYDPLEVNHFLGKSINLWKFFLSLRIFFHFKLLGGRLSNKCEMVGRACA